MECKDFEQSTIKDNKLLSLCRRLKNSTHDELLSFMEIEEEVLDNVLLYLIDEGNIIEQDGIYSYVRSSTPKSNIKRQNKNLHYMFQFHSQETIDLIVKLFCLKIPSQKAYHLVNLSQACIVGFYKEFRKLIYERQHKTLLNYFFEKPQIGRYRIFFEQYAHFYVYNDQVFVSEKLLRETKGKNFTKVEIQEFKKVYSYLTRQVAHNTNQAKIYHKLAEGIWRRERIFEDLYADLKDNLLNFISV